MIVIRTPGRVLEVDPAALEVQATSPPKRSTPREATFPHTRHL
ncbi:hypothetical protein TPChic_0896 [Treponema pallidum subsp. pallidum str. Chicago]|nr:hypothetical protein TPChic_0896 [Treponema pallidum subsp. pallidum str. Chicago]